MKQLLHTALTILILTSSYQAQEYTDFDWQYPHYGSHSLTNVKWIAGDKFLAVGDQGMILLTFDNGITWVMKQQPTQINMKGIYVKNEFSIFVVGSYANSNTSLYHSEDGGDTWTIIYENATMGLKDIHFADDNTGYIVGTLGKVVKSTDGGMTWTDISNSSINGDLQCVWFTSPDTGFVGKTTTFGMYKTVNGGQTWTQNFGYYFTNCYSMHFINDSVGWAGSYGNAIFKTVNGGLNWTTQSNPGLSEPIRSIAFADSARGIAVSTSYVYRTSNGASWSGTFFSNNFMSGTMSPSGFAVCGTTTGGIKQSTNYGSSFTEINPETGFSVFRRVKFVTSQIGWVGGDDGKILRTTDAGANWTLSSNVPYYSTCNDMAAISASKLIIATDEGTLRTTTNSGSTFTTITLDANIVLNAIHFPTSQVGYVGGNSGKLWKTTNGGTSYTLIDPGFTRDIKELFFSSNSIGYLIDDFSAVRKTIDGGNTWTTLNGSGIGASKQLWFTSDLNGYLVNGYGEVFKTIDGGQTITAAGNTCLQTPFDMHFINDSTGFVVGSFSNASCDVSYTSDGGNSWHSMLFPYAYAGWGVYGMDTSRVFLVGQNQTIIRSGNSDVITSINEAGFSNNDDNLFYPNPSNEYIQLNKSANSWMIYNLQGKVVKEGSSQTISTTDVSEGIYLIQIKQENGIHKTSKLIVIH
jgi:photosystem II stability/assembly factor-like uncharacterized protein